jgi:hypothetical protein
MYPYKIIVGEVQCESGFEIRQLLGEGIRQPRKSVPCHSHGQVLPFYIACRDVFTIMSASNPSGDEDRHALHAN